MRLIHSALLTLLFASGIAAAPSRRASHVVHERRANEPNPAKWARTERVDPSRVLPLKIGLAQQNLHLLEEKLMRVSHPKSAEYGKHWAPADVVNFFAPAEETVHAVTSWLAEAGFASERITISPNKGWIHVADATAAEVLYSASIILTSGCSYH
jgi:tripeptidyl-peptidase I